MATSLDFNNEREINLLNTITVSMCRTVYLANIQTL
jgi:hypothetical protein